jgi:hypothetical protein
VDPSFSWRLWEGKYDHAEIEEDVIRDSASHVFKLRIMRNFPTSRMDNVGSCHPMMKWKSGCQCFDIRISCLQAADHEKFLNIKNGQCWFLSSDDEWKSGCQMETFPYFLERPENGLFGISTL